MNPDGSFYYTGQRGGRWALISLLCFSIGPLLALIGTILQYPNDPSILQVDSILTTLGLLFILSIFTTSIGFVSGPIGTFWIAASGLSILIYGLSEDHKWFLRCSSKNSFEAELAALIPAMLFPSAVLATILLVSRFSKRKLSAKHIALIILGSALLAHGTLWYFHSLEKEISYVGC